MNRRSIAAAAGVLALAASLAGLAACKSKKAGNEMPDDKTLVAAGAFKALDIKERLAKFAPTEIGIDPALLTDEDRAVLNKLIEAARLIDGVFWRQAYPPGLALKDGQPFLSFAVQGGDTQDQNLLQFFLNIVEFGMNVQEACEAANITSYQMHDSFNDHVAVPGKLDLNERVPPWVRSDLARMGYRIEVRRYTSGPINAIFFDRVHGTFWGGSSNFGEDYGVIW